MTRKEHPEDFDRASAVQNHPDVLPRALRPENFFDPRYEVVCHNRLRSYSRFTEAIFAPAAELRSADSRGRPSPHGLWIQYSKNKRKVTRLRRIARERAILLRSR